MALITLARFETTTPAPSAHIAFGVWDPTPHRALRLPSTRADLCFINVLPSRRCPIDSAVPADVCGAWGAANASEAAWR